MVLPLWRISEEKCIVGEELKKKKTAEGGDEKHTDLDKEKSGDHT